MQVCLLLHWLVKKFAISAKMRVSCFHAVGVLSSASLFTGCSVIYPTGSVVGEIAGFTFESEHCTHKVAVLNWVFSLSTLRCKTEKHFDICVLWKLGGPPFHLDILRACIDTRPFASTIYG